MTHSLNILADIWHTVQVELGSSLWFIVGFFVVVGIVAQWRLYERAGKPGWACMIPGYNLIVFLEIVGRPASHIFLFLIPVYGQLYMIPKVWIEVCQSFGKRSIVDYVAVILLNGLYILNLGMSYDTVYEGPVYGREKAQNALKPQMA